MTTLVVLSVVLIVVFIAGLAGYLFVVGGQLSRIATLLEECAEIVSKINKDAQVIEPGVERINNTGGVIAGALPLLYGMAEDIVARRDVRARPRSATRAGCACHGFAAQSTARGRRVSPRAAVAINRFWGCSFLRAVRGLS